MYLLQISDDTFWQHLEIVGAVLIPVTLYWWDTRRRTEERHTQNLTRLTQIETMLEPLWEWWNKERGQSK